MSETTVVLIEDQPLVRTTVRRLLESDGFRVAGEAGEATEGVELALRARPDLCLVAVAIPGGGIRATREITRRLPGTTVVMLTSSTDHGDLIDSIRAGAAGYLLKSMDPGRLPIALRGVLAGEAAIPRELVAQLISDLQTHGRRRTVAGKDGRAELSAREFEVLELVCDGLSNRAIGERLAISPVTVRRHVSEIVRKLGVDSRGEAIELMRDGSG